MKTMTQSERLDYLVEAFIEDSKEYGDLRIPNDPEEKRRILRSLMNIRMPSSMSEEVLSVQDDYLTERNREKGIVTLNDIPEIKDGLSIWQGDITRLAVDAIVNAANSQMLGCFVPMHSCIDNCIHSFAGIQLRNECEEKMKQKRIQYGQDYEQPTAVPMLTWSVRISFSSTTMAVLMVCCSSAISASSLDCSFLAASYSAFSLRSPKPRAIRICSAISGRRTFSR